MGIKTAPPAGGFEEWEAARNEIQDFLALEHLEREVRDSWEDLARRISGWNEVQGFWTSENTGEKLMLMVTELAEAMEGHRTQAMSDKVPRFSAIEEELADTLIRIFDFAGYHGLSLADAFCAKLEYNLTRPYRHGKTC